MGLVVSGKIWTLEFRAKFPRVKGVEGKGVGGGGGGKRGRGSSREIERERVKAMLSSAWSLGWLTS